MFSNVNVLKAIAMSLLIRHRTNCNVVKNWTVNKLYNITRMHPKTIKKRLAILEEYGLVEYQGNHLILRSLVSRHKKRNIKLAKICYNKAKDVERSLQSILVAVIQLRKEYVKRTISEAHNGHDPVKVKSAMRTVRRHGWGFTYNEWGLSYKKIAKTLNNCKTTAVRIVNYAIKKGILSKTKNIERIYLPGINRHYCCGCTYTGVNYGYIVHSNIYSVAPCLFNF